MKGKETTYAIARRAGSNSLMQSSLLSQNCLKTASFYSESLMKWGESWQGILNAVSWLQCSYGATSLQQKYGCPQHGGEICLSFEPNPLIQCCFPPVINDPRSHVLSLAHRVVKSLERELIWSGGWKNQKDFYIWSKVLNCFAAGSCKRFKGLPSNFMQKWDHMLKIKA